MERNWSYTIKEGEHAGVTLWSGRYCAVCAIILCQAYIPNEHGTKEFKWFILANKRGTGTPDFQGKWNLPCGFMERGESGEQAATREAEEETGVFVYPNDFEFFSVETDPNTSNKGHVTLRYIAKLKRADLPATHVGEGGEANEVSSIAWIPLTDIEKYDWAFHHKELIYKVQETL